MTKKIIIVAVGIIIFGGIVWMARPDAELKSSGSVSGSLIIENGDFDFGEISMAAGNVSHAFKVKNIGDGPVVVKKAYTSCMCTEASLILGDRKFGPYGMAGHGFTPSINQEIKAGEEMTVEAVFDPAAHGPAGVGLIERAIIIENSAGEPMQLNFSALVRP